jgi:hypothetical protein
VFFLSVTHNSIDIRHEDSRLSELIPARDGDMDLKTSRFARHPANRGGLAIDIGPDGLRRLMIRKLGSGAVQGKPENDLCPFDWPGVLIEHLNHQRSHDPTLQIVHCMIAGEGHHLKAFDRRERFGRLRRLLNNGLLCEKAWWQSQNRGEERG